MNILFFKKYEENLKLYIFNVIVISLTVIVIITITD